MDLLKNKFFLYSLAVVILFLSVFLFVKIRNIYSQNCKVNSDCVFYEKKCCSPTCEYNHSVNRRYLSTLNVEFFFRCFYTLNRCPAIHCDSIVHKEPFCNKNNKCDVRVSSIKNLFGN